MSVVLYDSSPLEIVRLLGTLKHDRHSVAVTCVDNSSTTALRTIVESTGAEYLYPGRNLGYGGGHNLAMLRSIAHSRYHVVCNPDIDCSLATLHYLRDFMDSNPEVGLVMPRILYPDGREQRLCKLLPAPMDLFLRRFVPSVGGLGQRKRSQYELRGLDLSEVREIPSLSGCFMFLRSSVLDEIGLFDPRFFMYMEDVDLCRRVGEVARTVFCPQVSIRHGYSKGSYRNTRLLRYHIASAVRYFNKWGWVRDPMRRFLNQRVHLWDEGPQAEAHAQAEMSSSLKNVPASAGTR